MLFTIPPNVDLVITRAIQAYQPGWLTVILEFFTYITIPTVLVIVILAYLGFFHHHYSHQTKLKILLISAGNLLTPVLKIIFSRPRPTSDLVHIFVTESDHSFPSGHAAGIILFAAAIILLFYNKKSIYRYWLVLVNVLLILIICFSRIYLGVHWFTDIIGGIVFALLWIWISHFLAQRLIPHK
jgi:undecaprenyl-diphosphatase